MPKKLAQRAGAGDGQVASPDGWHELAVANPTFLLERLGSECTDLQGRRELTVNGLDAIAALGADASGRVVWDLDWERFDASGGRVRKLSVTDTGTGMTAGQLRYYINQLAANGRAQSLTGNFGVRAKVAAGSRNPHGLEYRLWQRGDGSLVCFRRDLDGRWGVEPQRWADGRADYWRPLGEAEKPWLLRGSDHGTQVVLLGQNERHDTTQAPQSVKDAGRQWITRYLNGRSVRLPTRVEVLVREDPGRGEPGQLRRIHGERHHVDRRALAAGAVQLSDALAHWWVLDGDHRARRRETVLWASTERAADRARQLARELELRFAQDTKLACKLNDAHDRSNRANDRLWRRMHPNGIAAVYGERPTAGSAAFAKNRSEALGAPDPLQTVQQIHWQIHKAHCDYQRVAEDRRRLGAEIGQIIRTFLDELMATGWSETEARHANIGGLAGSHEEA
jgi:hypothetical protein